jgi:hypothetical protein
MSFLNEKTINIYSLINLKKEIQADEIQHPTIAWVDALIYR